MSNYSIYRFITFESFVDLIQRRTLAFVNHNMWEDPYEGFFFKAIQKEEGKILIRNILQKISPDNFMPLYISLEAMTSCMHGQSWTKCSESDALWRIYSFNNRAIRVEVETNDISKLDKVTLAEISYNDFNNLEEEILNIIDTKNNTINLGKVLLRKRTAFDHEKEVRLLSDIDLNYLPDNKAETQRQLMNNALIQLKNKGELSQEQFEGGWKNNNQANELPIVKHINFSHIENFIKSVMVHPLAQVWYTETVETFCAMNSLKFLGKSKLYTFNI